MKDIALVFIVVISVPIALLVFWLWPEPSFTPPEGYSTLPQQVEELSQSVGGGVQSGQGVTIVPPASLGRAVNSTTFEISEEPNTLDARFNIVYYEGYDFFQISLEAEPLSETRRTAEQKFLSQLQISEDEACNLNVSVRTRLEVSEFYAGTELGLSFCPDSVQL